MPTEYGIHWATIEMTEEDAVNPGCTEAEQLETDVHEFAAATVVPLILKSMTRLGATCCKLKNLRKTSSYPIIATFDVQAPVNPTVNPSEAAVASAGQFLAKGSLKLSQVGDPYVPGQVQRVHASPLNAFAAK